MAVAASVQAIFDDTKRSVFKLTGVFSSAGTDEVNVVKIQGSQLAGALSVDSNNNVLVSQGGVPRTNYNFALGHIVADVNLPAGNSIQLIWSGSTAQTAATLSPGFKDMITESNMGTIWNNATSPTGNLLLTTTGSQANSSYTIFVEIKKGPNAGNSACDFNMGQIQKPVDFNFGPGGFGVTG